MLRILSFGRFEKMFPRFYSAAESTGYAEAVSELNTLQSNAQEISKGHQFPDEKFNFVKDYVIRKNVWMGNNNLPIIHVAGSKGKGSTCSYCESLLRSRGYRTGFFSSPHLIAVRERIRINGQPISEQLFTAHFWRIHEKLKLPHVEEEDKGCPNYFMFLLMMAMDVFKEQRVDVAIIEVGLGGQYDFTNLLKGVKVAGITSIGLEHTALLGSSVEEIAWQKAGILKPGIIAFVSPQDSQSALKVALSRANEAQCRLFVSPPLENYEWDSKEWRTVSKIIQSPLQDDNLSLAIQLASAFTHPEIYESIPETELEAPIVEVNARLVKAVKDCQWPGRYQILRGSRVTWYIDGAHTVDSIIRCALWYTSRPRVKEDFKLLIFNVTGGRNVAEFLKLLYDSVTFDYAIFCPNIVGGENQRLFAADRTVVGEDREENLSHCRRNLEEWRRLGGDGVTCETVSDALHRVERISEKRHTHALVTGSLHLIGATLAAINYKLVFPDV